MSAEEDRREFRRATANLRKVLWMEVGDVAFRLRWRWFSHGAYLKAMDAARDEANA